MNYYKKHKNQVNVLIIFLLSRIPMLVFAFLYKFGLKLVNTSGVSLIEKSSLLFSYIYDGAHYLTIASSGYITNNLYAFFPLYPYLIRLLHNISIPYSLAGIIISNISCFISLYVLYIMVRKKNNKYLYLLLFIFSIIWPFTTICYTESLYIMLSLLTYYFYKKREYLISGFFLGLSMLTRNTGYILLAAFFIDILYRYKCNNIKLKNILVFLFVSISLGSIYPIYLYIKTGDFLYFSTIQFEYWSRASGYLIFTIIEDVKFLISNLSIDRLYLFLLNWITWIIGLILSIKIFKKDRVSSIYMLLSLIFFTLSYRVPNDSIAVIPSISLFRYVLSLFPIYLYLPNMLSKNKTLNLIILTIIFAISIMNLIVVYLGSFIA